MRFIPDCKEAHQLTSEGLDRELSVVERLRMRLHLAMCEACTNFSGQMGLMRRAMQRIDDTDPPATPGDSK